MRRDLVLAAVVVGAAVALTALAGAWGIPRIDDWSYAHAAVSLAGGRPRLTGWNDMFLVGQLGLAVPLFRVLPAGVAGATFGAVAAAVALERGAALARRLVHPGAGPVALLALAGAGGFLALSTTFMTDVPAAAVELAGLGVGADALRRRSVRHFVAAIVVLCVAFTIRETTAAALVALVAVALASGRIPRRAVVTASGGAAAVLALATALRLGIDGGARVGFVPPPGAPRLADRVQDLVAATGTGGLVLLPVAVVALCRAPRVATTAKVAASAVGIGAVLALSAVRDRGRRLFAGELMHPYSSSAPESLWRVLEDLAVAGVALSLAAAVIRVAARRSGGDAGGGATVVAVTLALHLGGIVAFALAARPVFDRYLFVPVVLAAVLLIGPRVEGWRPPRLAVAAQAALVALALAFAGEQAAIAANGWRAGELAVAAGLDPARIDAGFAWSGVHHHGPVDPAAISSPGRADPWYAALLPGFDPCARVVPATGAEHPVAVHQPTRLQALLGADPVAVVADPGCR